MMRWLSSAGTWAIFLGLGFASVSEIKADPLPGAASARWITGVAMAPDSRLLAAAQYGGTATIWRITENK